MNGSTWYSDRSSQRLGGGIHEVEQISALSAKVDNVATMVQKLAQITLQNRNVSYVSTPSSPSRQVMICDLCGGGHDLGECLNDDTSSQSSMEHVDLVGYGRQQQSFQPQGAYNPNAPRNHPGFSWSNPNGAANPQSMAIETHLRDSKVNTIIEEPHHNNLGQLKDFNPKLRLFNQVHHYLLWKLHLHQIGKQ
nr:(-)-alpha-terpineol synthase-like [Ipomoea batatas]GME10481.1 (-)-alpha-terpineol synthase-like [Ipomoea batatas]